MEHDYKSRKLQEEMKEDQFELITQELNQRKKEKEKEIMELFYENQKQWRPPESNKNHRPEPKRILKPPPVPIAAIEQMVPICPIPEEPHSFLKTFIKDQKKLYSHSRTSKIMKNQFVRCPSG